MKHSGEHSAASPRPFLAGVTGGIGAGKSAVCAIIGRTYPVLSSDEIAKEMLVSNAEVRALVTEAFGNSAYLADGSPNREFLAGIVFNNPDKLALMNDIVHPATVAEMLRRAEALYAEGRRIVFVESALLYEAGVHELYDCIIVVVADPGIILARLAEGGSVSSADAKRRMANQLPQDEKAKRADFVIRNNGSAAELERNTRMILTIVESMAKQHAPS